MGLVIPSNEFDASNVIGTRGFGSQGISKFGAGIQGVRLGYRFSKYIYKRYFGYATRTYSRQTGTATGAGIGIGGGLVPIPSAFKRTSSRSIGQTRNNMGRLRSGLQRTNRQTTRRSCPPRCC